MATPAILLCPATLLGRVRAVAAGRSATDTLTRRPSSTKGPLVLLDMDQQALDAAYDQSKYAPNREQVQARRGLEWPIVMPVNTMTQIKATESAVLDRGSGRFYCPVFGAKPTGVRGGAQRRKGRAGPGAHPPLVCGRHKGARTPHLTAARRPSQRIALDCASRPVPGRAAGARPWSLVAGDWAFRSRQGKCAGPWGLHYSLLKPQ